MSKKFLSSLKNHLHISYGPEQAPRRNAPEDRWNFGIGNSGRPILEWRAELVLAAIQIQGLFGKEPLLFVDGSYASQAMVQGFRWSKMPYSCVVTKFKNDLNLAAFTETIAFLDSLQARYEVMEIDAEELFSDPKTIAWTKRYSTDLTRQILGMRVWQNLASRQVPVVFPFGLPLLKKNPEGWVILEFEKEYGLFQFQQEHKLLGVPNFFKWGPEMIAALLMDPTLKIALTKESKETVVTDALMRLVIQNYFPITVSRNWTGFENAEALLQKFHAAAKAASPGGLSAYSFPFVDYRDRLDFKGDREGFVPAEEDYTGSEDDEESEPEIKIDIPALTKSKTKKLA